MPDFLATIPESYGQWIVFGIMLVVALGVAWLLHTIFYAVARRITDRTSSDADSAVVKRTRRAALFMLMLLAVQIVLPRVPLDEGSLTVCRHIVSIGFIAVITWMVISVIGVIDDVIEKRYDITAADNLEARKVHTQTRVLSRTIMIIVGVIGFAAIIMTFPSIRQIGASLLASAGLAGLVVGLAARPTIGNLIAGLQIALTQPIRLDDVVIIDGEWGRIEEITSTYVVLRIWDQRRLIVPLQKVIEESFQNWTRESADILGTVFIHADYTVPFDAVREELKRIVEGSDKWDRRTVGLVVTEATERSVQLRALVSASNSSNAWDLRCHVREKLIEFLQREYPHCLPKGRSVVEDAETNAKSAAAASDAQQDDPQ